MLQSCAGLHIVFYGLKNFFVWYYRSLQKSHLFFVFFIIPSNIKNHITVYDQSKQSQLDYFLKLCSPHFGLLNRHTFWRYQLIESLPTISWYFISQEHNTQYYYIPPDINSTKVCRQHYHMHWAWLKSWQCRIFTSLCWFSAFYPFTKSVTNWTVDLLGE